MKSSCSDTTGGYFVTWMRILAVGRPLAETERIASPAFHLPQHHTFSGQLVALVQSGEKAGEAILSVSAKGLPTAKIRIQVTK